MTALKQAVESLGGQRGSTLNRAVTFADLIKAGFITAPQVQSSTGTIGNGDGSGNSTSSTAQLNPIPSLTFLANNTDAEAIPASTTLNAFLDSIFGTLAGTLIFRGESTWSPLDIGANGDVLTVVAGLPAWATPSITDQNIALSAAGTLLTVNGIALTL